MKTYSRKNSSYLKKAFVASNFDETCRLCLSEVDKVLIPIFQNKKISYQEWIDFTVDVMVEEGDGLPPNICKECFGTLEQSYLFKKKCKASDSKLREHLKLIELSEECRLNDSLLEDEEHGNTSVPTSDTKSNKSEPNGEINQAEVITAIWDNEGEVEEKPSKGVLDAHMKQSPENSEKVNACDSGGGRPPTIKQYSNNRTSAARPVVSQSSLLNVKHEPQEASILLSLSLNVEAKEVRNETEHEFNRSGTKLEEIRELWDNEEEVVVEIEEQNRNDNQNDEKPFFLSVTWEDNVVRERDMEIVEMKTEGDEIVEKHSQLVIDNVNISDYVVMQKEDGTVCEVCFKNFTCSKSLKRHMFVHTGVKPYVCNVCERKFSQSSILKRHMFTHSATKPFQCHICKRSYTQKMNLLTHMRKHGFKTNKKTYRCKTCSKSFEHPSGLSRHLKTHKGIIFPCPYCDKPFNDSSAMIRHKRNAHEFIAKRVLS